MTGTVSTDVSRETTARLVAFQDLLAKWTPRINLISRKDIDHIWTRHIEDALQLSSLVQKPGPHWLDIGSGGGLPGLVLAILHLETRPDARHTLIESDGRKAAFLTAAIRMLDLNVTVHVERSENVTPMEADVVTARALAPLDLLLTHVDRHMATSGQAILPKGRKASAEVETASLIWHFDYELSPSVTDPDASILLIKRLSRA